MRRSGYQPGGHRGAQEQSNNKYRPSEANNVMDNYFQLSQWQEQEAVPAET
ncbi:MAG TPA: hypothetical protein VGQ74_03435 [Methylomirabilota bacterium]|nr:hypothetical protein [Methylomirabilota bacterium]